MALLCVKTFWYMIYSNPNKKMRKKNYNFINEANDLAPKSLRMRFYYNKSWLSSWSKLKFCLKRENKDMIFGLNFDVTAGKFQKFHGCCLISMEVEI